MDYKERETILNTVDRVRNSILYNFVEMEKARQQLDYLTDLLRRAGIEHPADPVTQETKPC